MNRLVDLAVSVAKNRAGRVPHPSWCTFLVSYRCNARCGMCDSWRMKPGHELTANEIGAMFQKLGRLDVVRVTGGEPFLRKDIVDVVDAIQDASRPLVLHVTTNGSMPDEVEAFAARYPKPRRLSIMVSLDGHKDEHDRSRGDDVTYETAFATIRRLTALRDRRGVDVSVNYTVISPESVADTGRVRAELAAMGVEMSIVLAYAGSATYVIKLRGKRAEELIMPKGYPLHPALAGADVEGLVTEEMRIASKLASRTRRIGKQYYLRGLLARLRNEAHPAPHPRCVAVRSHIRLLPDGSVPVCQFNGETVGNLHTQSLHEVWHNPKADDARAWVDRCTGCWAECEVVPSAIYTGDFVANGWRAA
ncbi:MAG TPA: radical SAM protein [Polyangiaceae bacterium]|nr:radical SAM protein [Polyangiaceae bacterium]